MYFFPFLIPALLGLAVQQDAIRLVQVKKTRRGFRLEMACSRPLPADAIVDGKLIQIEKISTLLMEMVTVLQANKRKVAVSLSASQVLMRQISLPADMTEAEIEAEIQIHIQRELPGLKDPLAIDFAVLSSEGGYQQIHFAAVRETYLACVVSCVREAGLSVKCVDVDVAARQRALQYYPDIESWLRQADHINDAAFQADPLTFIVACGTAMRDMPRW